jgi:HK97 family phage major capsid protein
MSKKLPLVMRAVCESVWAIERSKLDAILGMLALRAEGVRFTKDEIRARIGGEPKQAKPRYGDAVAVIPVHGVIAHRMDTMVEISGGTSTEQVGKWFDNAMADESIGAIVLEFDSPGGTVNGVEELAEKIFKARGQKQVIAHVNSLAASAAYHLASQCDEIVCTPSGEAGSIGVYTVHMDVSKAMEEEGYKATLVSAGKYKVEGNPYEPLSEEAKDAMQARVDAAYDTFVKAVARGRGVSAADVRGGFGEGRVLDAKRAKAAGMVDRIASLDETIAKVAKCGSRGRMAATVEVLPLAANSIATTGPISLSITSGTSMWVADGSSVEPVSVVALGPASAGMEQSADGAATAHQGVPASAPKARGETMPEVPGTAAPTRVESAEVAQLKAEVERVKGLNALSAVHPEFFAAAPTKVQQWIDGNVTVANANTEILAFFKNRTAAAPHISAGGVTMSGVAPLEAGKNFGSPRYQALKAAVDAGTLKPDSRAFKAERNAAFGEQLIAVANHYSGRGTDPRLMATATGASAQVGSDGGFMVRKEFSVGLLESAFEGGEILSRVDSSEVGANADGLEVMYLLETDRATGSRWGGIQVYRGAEADAATAKRPKFGLWECRLQDVIGLAYVTERLLQDAPSIASVFSDGFAAEFQFQVENEVIRGIGGSQMVGILGNAPTVSVAKETGQLAATLDAKNVIKMYARMSPRARKNAVWLYNVECDVQLPQMMIGTGTSGVLVYMPPGGISGAQYGSIFGKPLIPVEYCAALGTVGDIILADLSAFKVITKGGLQTDDSIHVKFANNERTFRWLTRVNGAPKDKSAITPFKGSSTLSPFVTLDTRA